jgi:hypothetical protein
LWPMAIAVGCIWCIAIIGDDGFMVIGLPYDLKISPYD